MWCAVSTATAEPEHYCVGLLVLLALSLLLNRPLSGRGLLRHPPTPPAARSYHIAGLAVQQLAIAPTSLQVAVADSVSIMLSELSAEFAEFDWRVRRTSFPSFHDRGTAVATLADLRAEVRFRFVATPEGGLSIGDVGAHVAIGALNTRVLRSGTGPVRLPPLDWHSADGLRLIRSGCCCTAGRAEISRQYSVVC